MLEKIKEKVALLPKEIIEGGIYVELSKDDYSKIVKEVEELEYVVMKEQTLDFGKGITLEFNGTRVILVSNKGRGKDDLVYLAFRSKL